MAKTKEKFKKPIVNKTLLGLLPQQSKAERLSMTDSLNKNGCERPIVVWTETNEIADGMNRFAVCEELGIPYEIEYKSFKSEDEAIEYILELQLGRRSTQLADRAELFFKLMACKKRMSGVHTGDGETAEKIAKAAGVSTRTVYRGEAYAKALELHPEEKRDEIREKVRAGELSQQEVIKTAPPVLILCPRCQRVAPKTGLKDCPQCTTVRAGGKERPYVQPTKRRQPEPDRDACRDARDTLKNLRKKVIALLSGKAGTTLQKLARAHDAAFKFVEALKDGKTVRVPTWPAVDKLIDLMNEVWQAKYE